MSENTKIEWCDHTFNPWEGCQKVGPGCDNCYAETRNARFAGGTAINWGPGAPRRRTSASNWHKPRAWNGQQFFECTCCGWRGSMRDTEFHTPRKGCIHDLVPARARVFCSSLADVFDNAVPVQWRHDLSDLIEATPNLDWLLLTKRIGNAGAMLGEMFLDGPPDNLWLGATITDQPEADRDIPKLLAVPARVRFLSMEPLLGPVTLREVHSDMCEIDALTGDHGVLRPLRGRSEAKVHWIICGGESGPGARPMHPDWARSLRDQCEAAGVPFLFKQWGEWASVSESPVHPEATRIPGNLCRVTRDGVTTDHYIAISSNGGRRRYEMRRIGKKAAGRLLDGREWNGSPS